ncbi:phage GP46 family protein [Pseudomonas sp. zfem002]|uniref:phage GP46 family protein n=1 Tax=Pseudomonas sp. zfem002 TaxID=3078197 RepID=UPI00292921FA|nr:phage GP46 family protein [Pseudomonas sp. zfem002]MDU9391533.1 phage GP46 family protein [Pseudomonas sp. zfem002]
MISLSDDPGVRAWQRAAVISLLTWRRAEPGDNLDDQQRWGWWGDSFPTVANDKIGSRLWQLRRRTLTAETERDAVAFAREALAWMIEDGRVAAVAVTPVRGVNRLDLAVVLSMKNGTAIDVKFDNLWQVINAV